ncbi:MAG: MFS transporter [Verrucomicrobia bacterium]|nr:MFS transporter [Verrucomicrobiota bacterium]MDA1067104.1 MFS transporter [Verrucomicrobiota bacterium]
MNNPTNPNEKWYSGISRYQWIVLIIASLGWVFDVFEGQIFVASMREAMPSLVPESTSSGQIALYNNIALASFLLGGALGGIFFGMLSDRIGRKKTMTITIVFYSLFTCVSAFSQQWWHLAGLRFFVAMGVGGEWAVASTLVAEVFPKKARAHVGGIFHASSVLGSYLAVAAGTFLIGNTAVHAWAASSEMNWVTSFMDPLSLPWRLGFALGILPALLIIWIRKSLREPDSWIAARKQAAEEPEQRMGAISDLFKGVLLRRTLIGVTLATIGLATFWGSHIYGKDIFRNAVEQKILAADASVEYSAPLTLEDQTELLAQNAASLKRWEMLGMFIVTTGGGIGLLCFGPISQRRGRRFAFLFFHVGGLVSALLLFLVPLGVGSLYVILPIFGFLTLGMHAGYAIYFPELYPTRLRATGTGFCFNSGRILAAPVLFISGWMQKDWGFTLTTAAATLSLLFLLGIAVLPFCPETRGRELEE